MSFSEPFELFQVKFDNKCQIKTQKLDEKNVKTQKCTIVIFHEKLHSNAIYAKNRDFDNCAKQFIIAILQFCHFCNFSERKPHKIVFLLHFLHMNCKKSHFSDFYIQIYAKMKKMQFWLIENCDFMQFLQQFDKMLFSQLIACDKYVKNSKKLRNAVIIAQG